MKRIIFVSIAVLVSVTTFAQRGIPRTDNVSVSATNVKKITKQSDFKVKFQQMAELQLGVSFNETVLIGGTYTAGCRLSNWLFLGAGVGYQEYIWERSVPLYAQIRGYFSQKRIKPYASLSLGGVGYIDEYLYIDVFGDFSVGIEIPVHKKLNLTAGVGINTIGVPVKIGISF